MKTNTTRKEDIDFMNECVSTDGDKVNIDLAYVFQYINTHYDPGDVFETSYLEIWAEDNGYIKAD